MTAAARYDAAARQLAADAAAGAPDAWHWLTADIAATFPNADVCPVVIIPWGDVSGLMVDEQGDTVRVGIYLDLTDGSEWIALAECPDAVRAVALVDMLTELTPEGVDWADWAAHYATDIWPDTAEAADALAAARHLVARD
jgi:hypothetical protein